MINLHGHYQLLFASYRLLGEASKWLPWISLPKESLRKGRGGGGDSGMN